MTSVLDNLNPQDSTTPLYTFTDAQPTSPEPNNPDSSVSNFTDRHLTPTAITSAFPPVVTSNAHGMSNGETVRATKFVTKPVASATGMAQLNNRLFYVQEVTTNTFALYSVSSTPIDGTSYTTYVSGGQFTNTGPVLPVVNPSVFPT